MKERTFKIRGYPIIQDDCEHPARKGAHEVYLKDGTWFCRACGRIFNEKPTD